MQSETPVKRRPGRPCLEGSDKKSPLVFARVPPSTFEAVKRESERRGVVQGVIVREALDLLLRQAENHMAA
jgi:hypothetical protein